MEKPFDLVVKSAVRLSGAVSAPPSKSYTQRAVIIGAMDGSCRIYNPLRSDDTMNAVAVSRALGAEITDNGSFLDVRGYNGKPAPSGLTVNVGENGTLLRFSLALLSLSDGEVVVDGEKSLRKRPNTSIVHALQSLGVRIEGNGRDHTVPVKIQGQGGFKGGQVAIDGRTTSQAVSALLSIAPFAGDDVVLNITGELVSKPYVDITIDVLGWAGIKVINDSYSRFTVKSGQEFRMKPEVVIHGDYSSAAFLAAAAVLTSSDVLIEDLVPDSQGDMKIIGMLEQMGARVERGESSLRIRGAFELEGRDFDLSGTPDLAPVLTVLGCFAKGRTRLYNASHLLYKESNRLAQPAGELRKLGARITESPDGLVIEESSLSSGEVFSWGDHRVAMALAVAGLRIEGGLKIKNAECISKSYPGFISDMRGLKAGMSELP